MCASNYYKILILISIENVVFATESYSRQFFLGVQHINMFDFQQMSHTYSLKKIMNGKISEKYHEFTINI